LFLPIVWLLSLAGCARQSAPLPAEAPAPPPALPLAPPPAAPIPWLEVLQSVLFWAVFTGVVAYSLVQFIRQNPQMMRWLKSIKIFNLFGSLLSWLQGWLTGAGKQAAVLFSAARRRLFSRQSLEGPNPMRSWLNFRQLSARQKVIFYYLRLVERGGEHGLKRDIFQTPSQYAQTLENNLPEVHQDIAGITDTFLEARYSSHPIDQQRPTLVQQFWRNITRSLSRVRKSK
jgi:hypothetical protein